MKFLQKALDYPVWWLHSAGGGTPFLPFFFFPLAIRLSWPLGVFVFDNILILYLHSGDGQAGTQGCSASGCHLEIS